MMLFSLSSVDASASREGGLQCAQSIGHGTCGSAGCCAVCTRVLPSLNYGVAEWSDGGFSLMLINK